MQWFNNLRFVRKIQGGFFVIAAISTLVVFSGYFQLNKMSDVKNEIFENYVFPQVQIQLVYSEFQKIQFIMMQFSIEEFKSKFSENVQTYEHLKSSVDKFIDTLIISNSAYEFNEELLSVKNIWSDYKAIVADAILSASVTGNYEMAADIAVSSGEEVGKKLHEKFDIIRGLLSEKADYLNSAAEETVTKSLYFVISGAVAGSCIFLFFVLYIAPAISKPLEYLKSVVKEFALGNYEMEIHNDSKDEVGELTDLFKELQKAQVEKIKYAEGIASGIIEKISLKSDKDTLAIAFNKEAEIINDILNEANNLIKANEEGNFDIRANAEKFSGSWRQLIEGINSIQDALLAPIKESSEILAHLACGDLSARVKGDYKGDHQLIKNSINTVADSLSKTIMHVKEAVTSAASTSRQISSNTEEMSAASKKQSAQTSEVAAAIEQMTITIIETTKNAGTAAENARNAGEIASTGGTVVDFTVQGMKRISDVVSETAVTVKELGRSSTQIGDIIQVIDDIADQTNLLALNAAIEAARAGEQGRGFAVVADEVRKLAERTTKATKEIADMIKKIQLDTNRAVTKIEEGTIEVEKGKELAYKAGQSLKEIISASVNVVDDIKQVASASEEQSATAEQISRNIESINSVTHESAASIQQLAHTAEDLNRLTENLQNLINRFKISDENEEHFFVRRNGKLIAD